MKPWLGTFLFIAVGLFAAGLVGFYPAFTNGKAVIDDEQDGFDGRYVIKFSHVVAENTPKGLAAQRFADLVEEKTGNRVKVEVFPNGILYDESDEKQALKRGEVQMIAPSFSNLSVLLPEWAVMDLPYVFLSEDAVQEAFQGEVGQILFERLEESNMKGLAFWSNGFKQMTSNRGPLTHPSDFAGQRFRILPSRIIEEQFSALGAYTASIPFNEVYREFEAGTVDGGENTITNIYSKKFYKVQKYMTISNHGYLGYAVLMNKPFWDRLPPELQIAIEQAMEETTDWINRYAVQMDKRYLEQIKQDGYTQIHMLSDGERAEWMLQWEPLYRKSERLFGQELMQAIRNLQRKYES